MKCVSHENLMTLIWLANLDNLSKYSVKAKEKFEGTFSKYLFWNGSSSTFWCFNLFVEKNSTGKDGFMEVRL